jgi:CRP-like cAMP-binding protein
VKITNRLIGSLPASERRRLLADCEPVELVFGQVLCEPGEAYRHAYFPVQGFISTVATVGNHQPLEIRLIGNEGMLGATLVLGVNTVPLRALVQGTGSAWRIGAAQLRAGLRESPGLLRQLKRYLYVLVAQLSQSTGCNRFHDVEGRLARWLLMTHDRAHVDHFHLTHEFLADMLGVRRSGITVAAGNLQRRDLISYVRGTITVLDRRGLEAAACGCYAAVLEDYAQILG